MSGAHRLSRRLGWLAWCSMIVSTAVGVLAPTAPGATVRVDIFVTAVGVIFGSMAARTALLARVQPQRRPALLALTATLVLWLAGGVALSQAQGTQRVDFPAPGELIFLCAYVALTLTVLLDVKQNPKRSGATAWLDAVIVMGGAACAAIVVVIAPLTAFAGADGMSMRLAVLYPMLDLTLLVIVIGQTALGRRAGDRWTAMLMAGLVSFALTDASLISTASNGWYQASVTLDLGYGLTFLLIVEAVCRRRPPPLSPPNDRRVADDLSARLVVFAGSSALATMLVPEPERIHDLVHAVVFTTLIAVLVRLLQALRQAQRVNDAVRLARTDDLTGLPNRRALDAELEAQSGATSPLGLLLLDLDGFKEVNDTLGHAAGDATLQVIAHRLREATEVGGIVARLGGDEFAILFLHDRREDLLEQAGALRALVRKPVRVDGVDIALDVSIGVAVRRDGSLDADLLREADIAMYQAKRSGGGAMLYSPEADVFSRERLGAADALRRGIITGEIVVWYQPKIRTETGEFCGAEALVRWERADGELLSPAQFLPVARRTALMPDLTRVVLEHVVRDAAQWRRAGLDVQVAVNVDPAELLAPSVMDDLFRLVAAARLEPAALVIEVTEDSFLAHPDQARRAIREIRAAGLEVSIDDYGTGFSSLSYLRDLPVQELKIDRSFVAGLVDNPRNEMIIRTTRDLASGLGLRTVAEGVEDEQTAGRLRELGIDVLQGYLVARPMPFAAILPWFCRHRDGVLKPAATQ